MSTPGTASAGSSPPVGFAATAAAVWPDPLEMPVKTDGPADLRAEAMRLDRERGSRTDLSGLWRDLISGSLRVAHEFNTSHRCYLVLEVARPGPPETETDRRARTLLEEILCGRAQKVLALTCRLSNSTVNVNARRVLMAMGSRATASRASPLLAIAAHAFRQTVPAYGRRACFELGGRQYEVVSAARPDRHFVAALPPAEAAVVALLVEGRTHAEIAASRGTSPRTVANQLASVFRRMGVSGRGELLHRMISEVPLQ